jgi:hypothetical protein
VSEPDAACRINPKPAGILEIVMRQGNRRAGRWTAIELSLPACAAQESTMQKNPNKPKPRGTPGGSGEANEPVSEARAAVEAERRAEVLREPLRDPKLYCLWRR